MFMLESIIFSINFFCCQGKLYTVTAESGNSDKRFEVIQNSTQAYEDSATKPEPTVHQNFTLNGQVIITCPNNSLSNASSNTNNSNTHFNGVDTPQTFPNITTEYALMVLQQPLDYESTTSYLIKLKVEDDTGGIGYITVLVGLIFFVLCSLLSFNKTNNDSRYILDVGS